MACGITFLEIPCAPTARTIGPPAREWPLRGTQLLRGKIETGLDESFCIKHDTVLKPRGIRNGSRHYEQIGNTLLFGLATLLVPPTPEVVPKFSAAFGWSASGAQLAKLGLRLRLSV